MPDWLPLLAVIATLVPLVLLERWIHQHLHGLALLATGNDDAALLLYALLLLPGVALHELSHWAMARLLGVRTAGMNLWPRRQRDGRIRLYGYCESLGGYLRVVLLSDGETVHNALRDEDFAP